MGPKLSGGEEVAMRQGGGKQKLFDEREVG
jgi:hypothetical protein